MRLSGKDLGAWLRLARTSTVGPVTFERLLKRYGDVTTALNDLPRIIRNKSVKVPTLDEIQAEIEVSHERGIDIIASCEKRYPKLLKQLSPPPPIISAWGNLSLSEKPSIAIVGSRNASAMGQKFTRTLAHDLGEMGYVIVSGLARGIDRNAHVAALSSGTIAVLGGGVDHIYPRENTDLYHDIKDQGLIVSESPLGYKATARDFPRRNRIISGLSSAVIIVEAAQRSGTLITARYALEQNREVMAVPGSPLDPRAKGCNQLIQQGAALITNATDVHDIIERLPRPDLFEPDGFDFQAEPFDYTKAGPDIAQAKPKLLALLGPSFAPRDEVIRLSGLPISIANAALLELELNAEIISSNDGRIGLKL